MLSLLLLSLLLLLLLLLLLMLLLQARQLLSKYTTQNKAPKSHGQGSPVDKVCRDQHFCKQKAKASF